MLYKINTAVLHGIEALNIVVETGIYEGLPSFNVVGLADIMVKEAKERLRSAIKYSGFNYPRGRITVNMAPAYIRKRGTHLDLSMAVGILAGTGQILGERLHKYCFAGELSLDGSINSVDGILPIVISAKQAGLENIIIPEGNAQEASLAEGINIYTAKSLKSVADYFNLKENLPKIAKISKENWGNVKYNIDFSDVKGQESVKRAILVAAAGGHGILMVGSPGSGKTMLAERIPTILPEMSPEEIIKATIIYSISGLLSEELPYVAKRPFRKPYHGSGEIALTGGGLYPKPGEMSLASGGVLFLDELGEFNRNTIETLREPLEKHSISLVRNSENYTFPANFMLVAATNPCRCGYYGDSEHQCICTDYQVMQYQSKLSGPILDRIDMHVKLNNVKYDELKNSSSMSSAEMRAMVSRAAEIQQKRFKGLKCRCNADMSIKETMEFAALNEECESILAKAYDALSLDPRTLLKTRKIARTIADVEESENIEVEHLLEALSYRQNLFGLARRT